MDMQNELKGIESWYKIESKLNRCVETFNLIKPNEDEINLVLFSEFRDNNLWNFYSSICAKIICKIFYMDDLYNEIELWCEDELYNLIGDSDYHTKKTIIKKLN